MSKNPLRDHPQDGVVTILNDVLANGLTGTAPTLKAGDVVRRKGIWLVMGDDVAAGGTGTGTAHCYGRFTLPKATGWVGKRGQPVGYDFTNKVIVTDLSAGVMGVLAEDAATGDTSASVNLNVGRQRQFTDTLTPSAGQATANTMDVDLGFPWANATWIVNIFNSDGTLYTTGFSVNGKAGAGNENIITIAGTDIVTSQKVHILAFETDSANI